MHYSQMNEIFCVKVEYDHMMNIQITTYEFVEFEYYAKMIRALKWAPNDMQ